MSLSRFRGMLNDFYGRASKHCKLTRCTYLVLSFRFFVFKMLCLVSEARWSSSMVWMVWVRFSRRPLFSVNWDFKVLEKLLQESPCVDLGIKLSVKCLCVKDI